MTPSPDLIPQLISHSREMEFGLLQSQSNLIAALSGLHSLDELTQSHLRAASTPAPEILTPAVPASISRNETPAPAPQPAAKHYRTTKQEYAAALGQPNQDELVRALFEYQRKKGLRPQSSAIIPGKKSPASSAFAAFAPMTVPEIQAEPKDSPIASSRSPGVRVPVLRTKPI